MKRPLILAFCLVSLFSLPSFAADGEQKLEIERGTWSTEDDKIPHRKTYRLLCIEGLNFLSMEGYGGGQSSSTAVHLIQVLDKSGKPKTCK
ncbi:hypothetical protein ACUUL3_14340 [Thiovibrio sp. JS02]